MGPESSSVYSSLPLNLDITDANKAFITCSIESDQGFMSFNLTSEDDFVPATVGMPTSTRYAPNQTFSFLSTDAQAKASLWWGETLL